MRFKSFDINLGKKFILVFILWVKWLFWLRRWKEVLHVYIHNLELNVIPNQIALYNSLSIIMGIILHDVLQKTIKIFYFSRFKPSSLQFTPTQLLSAVMDTLLGKFWQFFEAILCIQFSEILYCHFWKVIASFASLIRQLVNRLIVKEERTKRKLWMNLKLSAFVVGAAPWLIPDPDSKNYENEITASERKKIIANFRYFTSYSFS